VGRTKRKPVHVISTLQRPVPLRHFLWHKGRLLNIVDQARTPRFTRPTVRVPQIWFVHEYPPFAMFVFLTTTTTTTHTHTHTTVRHGVYAQA